MYWSENPESVRAWAMDHVLVNKEAAFRRLFTSPVVNSFNTGAHGNTIAHLVACVESIIVPGLSEQAIDPFRSRVAYLAILEARTNAQLHFLGGAPCQLPCSQVSSALCAWTKSKTR